MTELPLWAVYVVSFGTPLCALAGVLISGWWNGRRQRQQMFQRHLEWASELALSSDERTRAFGVGQLDALRQSPWYSVRDEALLAAALEEALQPAAGDIDASSAKILLVQTGEPGETEGDDIEDGD
ncbi:hypothetical protein GCM10011575_30540 [Microlunatus endophyticus]|uniref:Uncharacterized protein n=1 Tax=Microlunatus endophyticus TaxID=1716077 RepID=A0A917W6J0_9ACTN|nr:hypothetical protein [Microlunatus endophyticus]GGL69872.1 hypothetical protein GCM10011575_30540 [Microlunatus endophyticus]